MYEDLLKKIDECIYNFLQINVNIMPIRFVKFIAYFYTDARVRKLYLERLGVRMGKNSYANLGFMIATDDYDEHIVIGDNVSIAPNVTFVVSSSANNGVEINSIPYIKDKLTKQANIIIDDEVWIGANVTILPGVHIGRCSVIGAGSVVTKDVMPYTIVAGVPAREIRRLTEE